MKYSTIADLIKLEPGVRVSVNSTTWIVYNDGDWVVYQHPPYAKRTRELYRGTDEAAAISAAIGEDETEGEER